MELHILESHILYKYTNLDQQKLLNQNQQLRTKNYRHL
jgi:hypothetical protein